MIERPSMHQNTPVMMTRMSHKTGARWFWSFKHKSHHLPPPYRCPSIKIRDAVMFWGVYPS